MQRINEQPFIISNETSTFIHAWLFVYLRILGEIRVITVDVVDIVRVDWKHKKLHSAPHPFTAYK
jgi:hypothetical protein